MEKNAESNMTLSPSVKFQLKLAEVAFTLFCFVVRL